MSWVRPYDWCDQTGAMTAGKAFAYPDDLGARDRRGPRKNVALIGGGIAGLSAAFELAVLGHRVTIFEAAARFGGRIFTERFGDRGGPYAELGAMRIPYGHGCVDHYVSTFRLRTRPFVSDNTNAYYAFRGQRIRRWDWPAAAALFGSARDWPLVARDLASSQPRPSPAEMWGQVLGRWSQAQLAQMESRSLAQLAADAIERGFVSAEDWAWLRQVKGFGWIDDASVLFWDNVGALLDAVGRYELEGGMGTLVDAFVAALTGLDNVRLRLQAPVSRVQLDATSVRVTTHQTEQFDYAIVALPAPCVARLTFGPELPADQMDALRAVYYFPIAKSVALCDQRFWEADGIFGGSSATDLPNQQVWYPSDNARPLTDADADHLEVRLATFGLQLGAEAPSEPTEWKARDRDVSAGPGALIAGYMWGINAQRFASLAAMDRDQLIRECLERIHPGTSGHVKQIVHRVWAEQVSPGGGGFAYFRPTEQRRFGALLCQPHGVGESKRVFFAGEHDGIAQGWIQGAIQSALAAVASVLGSP